MALSALFIFATCILFDRGENLRFKWLLEPVLFVFVVAQFHAFWNYRSPVPAQAPAVGRRC